MKILSVTWRWYPTGGDWTYIENINKLYESKGFEVIPFATNCENNIPSKFSEYFVDSFDFKELNKNKSISNGIKVLKTAIVSKDALNKLDKLLDNFDIKIAHLHNIHNYITPAIIKKLKDRGITVIWTLHDYKIICPENSFVSNGKVCEKCLNGSFYECALNVCKKKSFLASTMASIEAYYYTRNGTYNLVDYFWCPSEFLYNKFLEAGFPSKKLLVTNYCYDGLLIDKFLESRLLKSIEPSFIKPYILYVGRLEKIKGIETLIKAVKGTNVNLKIIGSGSAETELKMIIDETDYNIEFLGFKNKESVFELTDKCQFVVCPSEWYENFPFSIIESFLLSKPVIGSRIGGIPELVHNGITGFLFDPGNVEDLRKKILFLWDNFELVALMGTKARTHATSLVDEEIHWNKIKGVFS